MREKFQRFGGAMFTPVLLFSFAGIIIAFASVFRNEMIVGSIASEGTFWWQCWSVLANGAWTVFNQMEILFVIGLPIGLAKKANARAAMESLVTYLTFQYFVSTILDFWGKNFGVDFSAEAGGTSGLKMLAGIKTLDTGILGAIIISAIVVYIHNRYFEKKLPEVLGVFQGSTFVYMIGFFAMILMALITCLIWPKVQLGISSMQTFFTSTGVFGVGLYTFLERFLIPTGLHHFIYSPFDYGPAIVEDGLVKYWFAHLPEFAATTKPLKSIYPQGGFSLTGGSKMFGTLGMAAAFYFTSDKSRRKKTLAVILPAALTAFLTGITEPFEFTFLFIAPPLFLAHSILAGLMAAVWYQFGVVGMFTNGLIRNLGESWMPLFANHKGMIFTQIIIGLLFSVVYFFIFRFLILKFDFKTPGREEDGEVKLYTKAEFKEAKAGAKAKGSDPYIERAEVFLNAFGGASNIDTINNCATRLRIKVKDETIVGTDAEFKAGGAHGVVRGGQSFQIIVGLDVPQVREKFEDLVNTAAE